MSNFPMTIDSEGIDALIKSLIDDAAMYFKHGDREMCVRKLSQALLLTDSAVIHRCVRTPQPDE